MIFMQLEGFDAADCAIRLYNAGMFFFGYRPHSLTFDHRLVFVMSQLWVGDDLEKNPPPPDGPALTSIMEATAHKYEDAIVRRANGRDYNQGTPIGVEIPFKRTGYGIVKFLSGNKADDFGKTLFDSGLIVAKDQINGIYRVTSRHQLRTDNADQSRDFDRVVRAAAKEFGDVTVSDNPAG